MAATPARAPHELYNKVGPSCQACIALQKERRFEGNLSSTQMQTIKRKDANKARYRCDDCNKAFCATCADASVWDHTNNKLIAKPPEPYKTFLDYFNNRPKQTNLK